MKIGRHNISFMVMRSKEIRNRKLKTIRSQRTKISSNTLYSAKRSQSAKTSLARTLAEKRAMLKETNKKSTTSSTMLEKTKENYKAMEAAAENVVKNLEKLLNTKEGTLWGNEEAEPKTEPEREEILTKITNFLEDYNEMIQSLNSEGGTINEMYVRQFHNFAVSYKSKLEKIGITENKYGKLELSSKQLQEIGIENLKEVFQGEGSYADKVLERSKKITENAEANLNSLSNAAYSLLLANYGISGSRFNYQA